MTPKLYHGSDRFAWHARPWTYFAEHTNERTCAILPVYGMTDWGLGRPLDAEEVLASTLLDSALHLLPSAEAPLVLPPLRHLPALHPNMTLTIDSEVAHGMVADLARSVLASGIKRLLLFNSNPFCEEWIDVAARDLRVELGLQTFCINLSGLGYDFHNGRSADTRVLQSVLTHLLHSEADPEGIFALNDPLLHLLVRVEHPLALDAADPVASLRVGSEHLARLLTAIYQHPLLEESR